MSIIEINKELADGILENLEYLKVLQNINPDLEVPLGYISPAVSMLKYGSTVQIWDAPAFYRFIYSSIREDRKSRINDGSKIYKLINNLNPFMMDEICERFFYEEGIDDCDLENCSIESQVFKEYLEGYDVNCLQFKLPFISKYTKLLDELMDGIAESIVLDYDSGHERLIGYKIDKKTCVIRIWYFFDGYTGYYPDVSDYEETFKKILKEASC